MIPERNPGFGKVLDLLQVSLNILFWPSRSASSCESGASKASGTGSKQPFPLAPLSRNRVGPNKIMDETWSKSSKVCMVDRK